MKTFLLAALASTVCVGGIGRAVAAICEERHLDAVYGGGIMMKFSDGSFWQTVVVDVAGYALPNPQEIGTSALLCEWHNDYKILRHRDGSVVIRPLPTTRAPLAPLEWPC
jgi:hypothetical protein